jgi:hypothetical protein
MVKCGVLFEVRTEFLYITKKSFGFKELNNPRMAERFVMELGRWSLLEFVDTFQFQLK